MSKRLSILIFIFLIIPASISSLFASSWSVRILIGLLVGGIATILGLYLSRVMDVPCSPTIILFLGLGLLASVVITALMKLKLKPE